MSADLDQLLELVAVGDVTLGPDIIRRIAADYAQVVAERDEAHGGWKAALYVVEDRARLLVAGDRLAKTLKHALHSGDNFTVAVRVLDEWRAAKEEA